MVNRQVAASELPLSPLVKLRSLVLGRGMAERKNPARDRHPRSYHECQRLLQLAAITASPQMPFADPAGLSEAASKLIVP